MFAVMVMNAVRAGLIVCVCGLGQTRNDQPKQPGGPARTLATGTQQPGQDRQVKVFQLRFASADETAKCVASVLNTYAFADDRTNSVVVSASAEMLERATTLIQELDSRETPAQPSQQQSTAVIPVRNRSAEEVYQQLVRSLPDVRGSGGRVSADSSTGRLVITGSQDFIVNVERTIKILDVPAVSVPMEFVLLHLSIQKPPAEEAPNELACYTTALPEDLQSVADQLRDYGTARLLGHMSTRTLEGQRFGLEGKIGGDLDWSLEGIVDIAPQDGPVRIVLKAELNRRSTANPVAAIPEQMFKMSTTIVAQPGETIVLGTTPSGWKPGESCVLVLKVLDKQAAPNGAEPGIPGGGALRGARMPGQPKQPGRGR